MRLPPPLPAFHVSDDLEDWRAVATNVKMAGAQREAAGLKRNTIDDQPEHMYKEVMR